MMGQSPIQLCQRDLPKWIVESLRKGKVNLALLTGLGRDPMVYVLVAKDSECLGNRRRAYEYGCYFDPLFA